MKGANEFMSRVMEELNYQRQAHNSTLNRTEIDTFPRDAVVIVPKIHSDFCIENVLIVEWIGGSKRDAEFGKNEELNTHEKKDIRKQRENLVLIQLGIQCTIIQLLETEVMHADPLGGNLL